MCLNQTQGDRNEQNSFLIALIGLLLVQSQVLAQTSDFRSSKSRLSSRRWNEMISMAEWKPGVGGRFTFNLNKIFSLETAGYFFREMLQLPHNGNVTQVVGGVKVGKRFEKWGIFAKARPGVVSFSRGEFNVVPAPG